MVNEVVVTEQLTGEMVEAGKQLLSALDSAGIPVSAAFWLYFPEPETWRLVLASTRVSKFGPRKVYHDIQTVLLNLPDNKRLSLSDITVMENNAHLVASLRKGLGPAKSVGGVRLGGNIIDGQYIEKAYLYFLNPAQRKWAFSSRATD